MFLPSCSFLPSSSLSLTLLSSLSSLVRLRRSARGRHCSRPAADWFSDRAEETGLSFTHVNGMSGKFDYAEIIGSGVALFDMDNDGDLDVFSGPVTTGAEPAVSQRSRRNGTRLTSPT